MSHYSYDFSNLAEFDALAQSIAARLNCSASLISIIHEDTLVALGHSDHSLSKSDRTLAARDTICLRTIRAGSPVRLPDVRADDVLRNVPTVSAMNIGAYLGVPLKLEDGHVVGAICALSSEPRIWQDAEQDYLLAVADLAESKIERQVLRYEQKALSAALAENDAILTTLAETKGKALTVHNEAGELVFANSALRTDLHLSYQELLVLPHAAQNLVDRGMQAGAVSVDLPGRPCNALHVVVSQAKDGLTLAEWELAPHD